MRVQVLVAAMNQYNHSLLGKNAYTIRCYSGKSVRF